ncbi:MAG: hypothetical protein IPP74_10215 [Alphaproteobacteria bacterium]|nr:hypothetical protein [Alphaproteobacteria bacterium]
MSFNEDISNYFIDFGVDATFGAYTGKVILDTPDQVRMGDTVLSTEYMIRFKTALFPGLVYNSSITVNGESYVVRQVIKEDDGYISMAMLSKV